MRRATVADIPDLLPMGRKFHSLVSPKWELSEGGLSAVLSALMTTGYVARTEGGFIAGVIQPNPIAVNWLVASEFLWWAEDGHGIELQDSFRRWAVECGANEIRWSCPPGNKRVRRHYARHAAETEIIYSEIVPCA